MGDRGTGHSQAIHGSQSFTRLESSIRNRSSSVQKGLVAENVNNGVEGFPITETNSAQPEDMYEKKVSANGFATSTKGLLASTATSDANDDIPIEILSLIDRSELEVFLFQCLTK